FLGFDEAVRPVRPEVFPRADRARGPADDDPVDLVGRADADQQPGVVRRHHATAPLALAEDRPATEDELDAGADGVAIAAGPAQLEAEPAVVVLRVVPREGGGAVLVVDDDVEV